MLKHIIGKMDYFILFSTFMPYFLISYGVRIEHLVVYSALIIMFFKGKFFVINKNSFRSIILIFSLIIYFVLISSLGNNLTIDKGFLSNSENYIETLVLFIIFTSFFSKSDFFTSDRMIKINTFYHLLLLVNTSIILVEIFTPYADVLLSHYVNDELKGYNRLATNSMGRYMGIFQQPVESGFAYSLGLITWVYNFSKKRKRALLIEAVLFLSLFLGGLASVSKVFIFGGIGFSSVLFFALNRNRASVVTLLVSAVSFIFLIPLFAEDWKGYNYLEERVVGITTDFNINKITAGRVDSNSGIYNLVSKQDVSTFYGKGFTLGDLPFFDSEYVQIFYQGGGIALILYLLIIIKLYRRCFFLNHRFYDAKILFLVIITLGVFTAFGGPLFFMNRVRVFFFLQLLYLYKLSHARFYILKYEK